MLITQEQRNAILPAVADLHIQLEQPAYAGGLTAVDWRAFLARLLEVLGPQLLAFLIALLSAPKDPD
jgi:hypothetical protein